MLLREVALKNIRSYEEATIELPSGSILLSGDIGAGKSTILQAVEFALFGIRRGELAGSSLLRHGAQHAQVRITLDVDGKEVVIMRSLKRTGKSISQGAGYLILDGVRTDATAIELKSFVLELLGYPQGMLAKSRSPLFRFTVYTPQQEMNRILYESEQERLEALRKVFDIDKYQRVGEQSAALGKELRERSRMIAARLEESAQRTKEREELEQALSKAKTTLTSVRERQDLASKRASAAKEEVERLEKERFSAQELRRALEVKRTEHKAIRQRIEQLRFEARELEGHIAKMKVPTPAKQVDAALLEKARKEGEVLREQRADALDKRARNEARMQQARAIIERIGEHEECPTCLQKVRAEHVREVRERHQKVIDAATRNLERINAVIEALRRREEIAQGRQREIEEAINAQQLRLERERAAKERTTRLEALRAAIAELERKEKKLADQVEEHEAHHAKHVHDDRAFAQARERLEHLQREMTEIERRIGALEQECRLHTKHIKRLDERIAADERLRHEQQSIDQRERWVQTSFQNMVFAMERQLLLRIHHDFNAYFKRWFSMLIDEDALSVRLDDSFTPRPQQNGFETDIENLSGGERTALALAYRLALNTVINQFFSMIKTRDLLILDEPTDGFSADQLDRVRDVLDQLEISQVILVSHEQKIESFVDHVVRVEKHAHTSRVFTAS